MQQYFLNDNFLLRIFILVQSEILLWIKYIVGHICTHSDMQLLLINGYDIANMSI